MNFRVPGPICDVRSWSADSGTLMRVYCPVPSRFLLQCFPPEGAAPRSVTTFDADAAARFAKAHAEPASVHYCARYVMAAIARGFGAIPGDTKASSLLASASMKKIEETLGLPTFSNFPNHARNYGPVLEALGFVAAKSVKTKSVAKEDYSFRVGDVVIFQSTTKSVPGHIQIYDGKHWISDFVQKDPLWPNSSPLSTWQVEKPAYVIYTISDE